MPLLLPGAHPAYSVMTQRWADRSKLSGDLPQVQHRLTTTSPQSSSPSALTYRSSRRGPRAVHDTRIKSNTFVQVRELLGRCVLTLLFAALFHSQPVMGKPWIIETPHHVTFRTKICQPLSTSHLQKLMGPAYDEKNMAPDRATAKRMFGTDLEDPSPSGYQGDDPRIAYVVDNSDLVKEERLWESEEEVRMDEDVYTDQGLVERIEEVGEDMVKRRTWLPRKKVLNRRLESEVGSRAHYRDRTYDPAEPGYEGGQAPKRKTLLSDSFSYMKHRRRRRRRSVDQTNTRNQQRRYEDRDYESTDAVNIDEYGEGLEEEDYDTSSDTRPARGSVPLPMKLIMSGKNKKLRRQLKKKFRQKAKNMRKSPPWECKLRHKTLYMKEGIFPHVLQDGLCTVDDGKPAKCFYRLYTCVAIKYTISILQRDPNYCHPLPSATNTTVYEESWNLTSYQITVGCNCAAGSNDIIKYNRQMN